MKEIKRQVFRTILENNYVAYIIYIAMIAVCHLVAFFTRGALDLRLVVLEVIFVLVFLLHAADSLHKYYSFCQLFKKTMYATGLHEELTDDFKRAHALWDGCVLIGEKYVYTFVFKTAVLPVSEVKKFTYSCKKVPLSGVSTYNIILHEEHTYLEIARRPTTKYKESSIREEIEFANSLIQKREPFVT